MRVIHFPRKSIFAVLRYIIFAATSLCPLTSWGVGLSVDIVGLENEELDNIWNTLSIAQLLKKADLLDKVTRQKVTELEDISDRKIRRLHAAAEEEINLALRPFGYYQAKTVSNLKLEDEVWRAQYEIALGDPVIIDTVSIQISGSGLTNEAIQLQKLNTKLIKGKRLLHQDYGETKSGLLNSAVSAGYLDANFTQSQLRVNTGNNTAEVTLEMDTGSQYYFGPVTIEQNILNESFMQKYIPFKQGDVFDTDQLISLQLALSDSQYFERLEITADRDSAADYQIPVNVKAIPSRPRKYTVAAGYGTDTGARVKLGATINRINRRGHNIHTDLLISEIKQSASLQYEIPMGNAGTDSLRFLTRYEDEEVADGETQRLLLGTNYSDIWRGLKRRLYLNYLREDFRFGSNSNDVEFITPGISLSFSKADNLLLPKEGYSWFADLHGASDSVGSDTTFIQGKLVGQRVWSLGENSRLLTRLSYGATKVDSFDDLPTAERFFAGGDSSVRGYSFRSLGPEDEEGNTIGGRYLATANVEVDYLFYKDFGGALFIDLGDASNDSSFKLKRAVGTGLRWRSPVGMFRLDLATPLDDADSDYRIHISVGADL